MQKQPVSEVEAFPVSLHNTFTEHFCTTAPVPAADLWLNFRRCAKWNLGFRKQSEPPKGVLRTPLNPLLCIFFMLLCLALEEGQGEKEGKGQVCMLAITLFKQKLQKSFAAQNLGGEGGRGVRPLCTPLNPSLGIFWCYFVFYWKKVRASYLCCSKGNLKNLDLYKLWSHWRKNEVFH